MDKIDGLIAAPFTPLKSNGELNLELVGPYVDWLASNKVRGAFVNGSTADFASLSNTERKLLLEEWHKLRPERFLLVAHVGHTNMREAQELAQHAASLKVDAIATTPPYYFKPSNIQDLVEFCQNIAAVSEDVPFYYYHIPGLTGSYFKMVDFLELASSSIPNFKGIKFSDQDMMDFKFCLEFQNRKYDILFGVDEILLCASALGASGAVGSTYNHIAPLYLRMLDNFKSGHLDQAQRLQLKSMEFVKILLKYGLIPAGKATMRLMGLDLGPSRSPHQNLSEGQLESLKEELEEIEIFEYSFEPGGSQDDRK